MDELATRHCIRSARRLDAPAVAALLARLGHDWASAGDRLRRTYRLADFASALAFVNHIGAIAEAEDHHPDLRLGWGKVEVELWTHSVGGLSENDFVVAAQIERAFPGPVAG